MDKIQNQLISIIQDLIQEVCRQEAVEAGNLRFYLDLPQDRRFGDVSTNAALVYSRLLKRSPREIAAFLLPEIKKKIVADPDLSTYIQDVRIEGAGFINFYFARIYFYRLLKDILNGKKEALKKDSGKGKKVLLEFVSANPTGSLSVAHARQAAVGDALANILNFLGFAVQKEYYLNDEGNQINILGKSVELRIKELEGERIDFPENYYQGDYIVEIARRAKEEKIAQEALGDYAANYILKIIRNELDDFSVKFDSWYSQKELGKSGKIEAAFDYLKEKGFLYEEEGARWFKSTAFGDDKDRVVVKSDGSYTYLAPDIAYHQDKYKRGFEWLINLWGPDHHGYINRLKASVAAFGHDPESLSVIIVQLATIFRAGKPVQMSTRKGQYITLREVLDEVGADAARFFFLARRTNSHLDFDLEVAKKQTSENPVYYVQYAHARICSILRSANSAIDAEKIDFTLLKEKEELGLLKKIWEISSVLDICLNTQDPYMLTVYLQELAESFHKFYDQHRVLGEDRELSLARLSLIDGVRIVISASLELLGVSQPEKM